MNPQQGNASGSSGFLLAIFAVVAGIMIVWWLLPQWIVYPVFFLRLGELHVIHFFLHYWGELAQMLGFSAPSLDHVDELISSVTEYLASPKTIKYEVFVQLNREVGSVVRYPFIFIMLVLGFYIYRYSPVLHFRTAYNMNSLKKAEVSNWPKITPVSNINLVKQDIRKGPWSMAQTPLEFCQEHDLIFPKRELDYMTWGLNHSTAFRVLSLQLGPQLRSMNSLPIHLKALVVIFMYRVIDKTKESNQFLAQIASSASSGNLNFTGVEEAFSKIKNERAIQWTRARHDYVYSFMATLLEISRSDGVLASAEFLWLKPLDRRMWFMMNSVGRQTATVEIAGAYAHWLAEKKMGRGLKSPMIKEAVKALELAVGEVLYEEEGQSWRSKEA